MNAYVHRDYTKSSDIKVEFFDDRLITSSPGSLPDGLTVEDIKQGANAKRNPILINALDKMNYIENYGTGIRRIYSLKINLATKHPLEKQSSRMLKKISILSKNFCLFLSKIFFLKRIKFTNLIKLNKNNYSYLSLVRISCHLHVS